MIVDEPDEDADTLDDETALDNYLGGESPANLDTGLADLPDWPAPAKRDIGLDLDTATLNWFKQGHADWRREMRFVLRAWVLAKGSKPRMASTSLPAVSAIVHDRLDSRP
jgi:hypothetical protein